MRGVIQAFKSFSLLCPLVEQDPLKGTPYTADQTPIDLVISDDTTGDAQRDPCHLAQGSPPCHCASAIRNSFGSRPKEAPLYPILAAPSQSKVVHLLHDQSVREHFTEYIHTAGCTTSSIPQRRLLRAIVLRRPVVDLAHT
jgi:hypothetical protein